MTNDGIQILILIIDAIFIKYSSELSADRLETKLTLMKTARCYFGTKTGRPKMKDGVVTNFGTANSFITITFLKN